MNVKQIIESSYLKLSQKDIVDSMLKVKMVVSYVTTIPKVYLISHEDKELTEEQVTKINEYIDKIADGYPVQYITHEQYFRKLKLYVDDNVLIPQPDTEVLVDEAIKIIDDISCNFDGNTQMKMDPLKVLDLCTGSGAIVLSLANERPEHTYSATDISSEALKIANKNAEDNGLEIIFWQGDMFKALPEKYKFDLIVANPPYIETATLDILPKEVKHEPKLALDGGHDGLEFYRTIAKEAKDYLVPNGYVVVEIGFNQKVHVENIFKANWYKNVYTVQDLAGNDRVVIAQVGDK